MKTSDLNKTTEDIHFNGVHLSVLVSILLVNGVTSTVCSLRSCEFYEVISLHIIKVLPPHFLRHRLCEVYD
jgi:hypothetical protein